MRFSIRSVFIVVFQPVHDAVLFLTTERREIEQVVRVEQMVEAALIGRIGMEDAPALAPEHAQAFPLAFVGPSLGLVRDRRVIVDGVLRIERHAKVIVEVSPKRGHPAECPSHALLEGLDLCERRARDRRECGVARPEMQEAAREVGHHIRARGAGHVLPLGRDTEHEGSEDELRLLSEELGEGAAYAVAMDGVMPGTNPGAAMMRIPSATIARASGTSMAALAGSSFCANTRAAMTSIQVTFITPSATSITIIPMLEPTQ